MMSWGKGMLRCYSNRFLALVIAAAFSPLLVSAQMEDVEGSLPQDFDHRVIIKMKTSGASVSARRLLFANSGPMQACNLNSTMLYDLDVQIVKTDVGQRNCIAREVCKVAMQDNSVEYCVQDAAFHPDQINDEFHKDQYAAPLVHWPAAFQHLPARTSSPIVAIIDSGIDLNHPDLVDHLWTNPGEIPGNGIDDDQNGFIDDVHGYDFVRRDGTPDDETGHGTHCAGIIGAVINNKIGVAGMAPRPKIMALKFLPAPPAFGSLSDVLQAIDYSIKMNVSVSSNSYGCAGCGSQPLYWALRQTMQRRHIFVASAGNDGKDNDMFTYSPCDIKQNNTLCVAAVNQTDQMSWYSNWGNASVDLAAPGDAIMSTEDAGLYGLRTGTSMSAPMVAGLAAMLFSIKPTASNEEVRQVILNSTDYSPQLLGKVATSGRVNFCRASNLLQHGVLDHPSCTVQNTDMTITATTTTTTATTMSSYGKDGASGVAPPTQAPTTQSYTLTCDFEDVIHESTFCNEWTTSDVCADNAPRWKLWQKSTPSLATGPNAAASKLHFLYIEATHLLETDVAYLYSGEHVMLGGTTLSFAYHMFGPDIGTLGVQWAPAGSTAWTPVWQISGNQGDQWRSQSLRLSSIAGTKAWLRFFATGGRGVSGDIALDKVTFHDAAEAPQPVDMHANTSTPGSENAEIRGVIVLQVFTNQTANLTSQAAELAIDESLYRVLGIVSWVHFMTVTTDPLNASAADCLGGQATKCQPVPNASYWKSFLDANPGYSLMALGYLVDNVLGSHTERCAARLATRRLEAASTLSSVASSANQALATTAMTELIEYMKVTLAPLGSPVPSLIHISPKTPSTTQNLNPSATGNYQGNSGLVVLWLFVGLVLMALAVINLVLLVRRCGNKGPFQQLSKDSSSDEEESIE